MREAHLFIRNTACIACSKKHGPNRWPTTKHQRSDGLVRITAVYDRDGLVEMDQGCEKEQDKICPSESEDLLRVRYHYWPPNRPVISSSGLLHHESLGEVVSYYGPLTQCSSFLGNLWFNPSLCQRCRFFPCRRWQFSAR